MKSKHLLRCVVATAMLVGSLCAAHAFTVDACSWFSDTGSTDQVTGMAYRSDGKILMSAILPGPLPGGVQPRLLNGANAQAAGLVLLLEADGSSIQSAARVGPTVLDLSIDKNDNIALALGGGGVAVLDKDLSKVVWSRRAGASVRRVDMGSAGTVAALSNAMTGDAFEGTDAGAIFIYSATGDSIGATAGLNRTQDVAVDEFRRYIYFLGFQNKHSGCNPVQVSYIKTSKYDGTQVWKAYDWAGALLEPCNGATHENNMADTRGYRITLGKDGLLYCAFESAGGNHIFRRDPYDITKAVSIVQGDQWHSWYDTKSEHKCFVGRYNPDNGSYILGQQFCTRAFDATKNRWVGNTWRIGGGAIHADAQGRVYLVGGSASGLPIPKVPIYKPVAGGEAYNPFDSLVYTGGAYLTVMNSSFSKRLFCGRLCGGSSRAVAVGNKTSSGTVPVAFGGRAQTLGTNFKDNPAWLLDKKNPLQFTNAGGASEGFFATLTVNLDQPTSVDQDHRTQRGAPDHPILPSLSRPLTNRNAVVFSIQGRSIRFAESTARTHRIYQPCFLIRKASRPE